MEPRTFSYDGTEPQIHEDAAVSTECIVAGDVTIEADVTIWPGVVLRGDVAPMVLEEGSAVGDNAVLHGTTVEANAMIGHAAVLNDTHIGEETMIGFNATVSHSKIGRQSLVAMGSVVPEDYEVPPESFVRGTPAQVTPLSETDIDRESVFAEYSDDEYGELVGGYEKLF